MRGIFRAEMIPGNPEKLPQKITQKIINLKL